jgi:hypothetical protein
MSSISGPCRRAKLAGTGSLYELVGRRRTLARLVKHYRIRSKQTDSEWIKHLVIFRGKVRQSALGAVKVDAVPHILFEGPHTAVRQGC